jgi:ligand-binding SRPBCC domain-containing protein
VLPPTLTLENRAAHQLLFLLNSLQNELAKRRNRRQSAPDHQNKTLTNHLTKEFNFRTEFWLRSPCENVFSFFAEPRNLETITPPWLHFKVLTPGPITMQAGTLIDYRIRIHRVPIPWRTEIAEWNPPHHFVDVQLRGPYTLWRHTHSFEERDCGTICLDDVRYHPRGGAFANWLFVRRDLERISTFRREKMTRIFREDSSIGSPGKSFVGSNTTKDTPRRGIF